MFRSCTASLSSRTLARSAASPSHPARRRMALAMGAGARRHYSEEKTSSTPESPSGAEGAKEEASPKAESTLESEALKKLEAKEAEVVDLTVRSHSAYCFFLIID